MASPLRCHLLIGPPGSGKTTFARRMAPWLQGPGGEPGLVLSTDGIREELFGDGAILVPWDEIRVVPLARLHQAVAKGVPVAVIEESDSAIRHRHFGPSRAEGFALVESLNPAVESIEPEAISVSATPPPKPFVPICPGWRPMAFSGLTGGARDRSWRAIHRIPRAARFMAAIPRWPMPVSSGVCSPCCGTFSRSLSMLRRQPGRATGDTGKGNRISTAA